MVMLIEQAGPRFDELGLKTKWLIADTSNIDGSIAYARSMLKNEVIHPYLGIFPNHSWDSDSPDSDYLEVREYALELARIYSRVLKLTGATTMLYWEMMGSDYSINDGTQPYPSFNVIRQLGQQFPSGLLIVETSDNTEGLFSVAAQAPDHFVIFMINTGEKALTMNLEVLPDGTYSHIQTTETELETTLATYQVPNEYVNFQIPGKSIHVLSTRKP
jgi:hypothetical protein